MGFEIQFSESSYQKFVSILDQKFGLMKSAENFGNLGTDSYFFTFKHKIQSTFLWFQKSDFINIGIKSSLVI